MWVKEVALGLCCYGLFSSVSLGATQGAVGATSTGSFDLTFQPLVQVRIFGLSSVGVYPIDLGIDATGHSTACVYSNQGLPEGLYHIEAESQYGGTTHFIASDGVSTIEYTPIWHDATRQEAFKPGQVLLKREGAQNEAFYCDNPNAKVTVKFLAEDMQAVPASIYSDRLMLTVMPI